VSPAPGQRTRRAAVIWPYSTGLWLGRTLASKGWDAVAVRPPDPAACGMPDLDQVLHGEHWAQVLTGPVSAKALAQVLAGVAAVLPGDESAVPLTERVAARLGLAGNDWRTTGRRTDKATMQEALRRADVACPQTIRAASKTAALAAARRIRYPVVVKPRWSASSVGFHLCHTPAQAAAAWDALAGQPGALGEITSTVAVQEFLDGQKWTVDTVTVRVPGRARPVHVITSLWRERVVLTGGGVAWDQSWLVPPATLAGDAAAREVAAYARAVLDVAGVTQGPACTEVVLTREGPRLVEVMGRLAGCYPVHLVELVTGQSQLTTTVDALSNPHRVARRAAPSATGGLAVAQVWLIAPRDGFLDGAVLAKIGGLPTVTALPPGLADGTAVVRTDDTPRSPGRLNLLGPAAEVERDITTIRALEHDLYRRCA